MGLQGALVDRARAVERRPAGRRVEGRTVYGERKGAWFRCRLTLPSAPETTDQAGEPEVAEPATLLCGTRDTEGGALALSPRLRLEVSSPELGVALWQVVGEPEPLRKKRRVIGWQAQLRRVVSRTADGAV